jgi:sugar phosphate isomerase/epimerase
MQDNIYISSNAFRDKNLVNIINICRENSITNLELGPRVICSGGQIEVKEILHSNCEQMRFLLHHYFPRVDKDFVLNLASDSKIILSKSIKYCKDAIDISSEINAPFFGVHAGFAFHATANNLGGSLWGLPKIPYQKAYRIFVESISELSAYAAGKNVKIVVENNVILPNNLENGKNNLLLLAELEETIKFFKEVQSDNLFYLMDLGHLKINSVALGFNINEFVQSMLPFTIALHLSENDTLRDSHLLFNKEVWFKDIIRKNKEKILIIELFNSDISEIIDCYNVVEGIVKS